jgi:ribosome biogenesis GTPase
VCSLRGKFREDSSGRLPVVVGDRVRVTLTAPGEGVLEEVLPRQSEVRRARALTERQGAARRRGARLRGPSPETVVAANADQVLLVLAAREPQPRWALADRVLISAESEDLAAGICLNKWDLAEDDLDTARELGEWLEVYRRLGYAVFKTSATCGRGLEDLRGWLSGKVTVLSGHSGVGKSTLLNALSPGLDIETASVNPITGKGVQTTTEVALYALPAGGHLVDTPGYREYGLAALEPAEVGRYYCEFRPHLGECRFKDCLHVEEPDCAVLEALERGAISERRYQNYLQILDSLEHGSARGVGGAQGAL